jgi:hypothetical protein
MARMIEEMERMPPVDPKPRTIAQNMGLYEHHPTEAPCARCGRPTTAMVLTAYQKLPRPKRFSFEAVHQCAVCRCDRVLAQLANWDAPRDVYLRHVWTRYRRMLLRISQGDARETGCQPSSLARCGERSTQGAP